MWYWMTNRKWLSQNKSGMSFNNDEFRLFWTTFRKLVLSPSAKYNHVEKSQRVSLEKEHPTHCFKNFFI